MHKMLYTTLIILFSLNLSIAQVDTCQEDIERIIETVGATCENLGRNQLCYGNWRIDSEITTNAAFSEVGDMLDVGDLLSLRTYPLSLENDEWGIALFNLQANVSGTIAGQSATVVVFGDTELASTSEADEAYAAPMQAFTFRTGIGTPACQDLPDSGLLIQVSPETSLNLMINGYELELGSTAFFNAAAEDELTIATLEGLVRVDIAGTERLIPEGFSLSLSPEALPASPSAAAELIVPLSALLPNPIPQVGEPSGQGFYFMDCMNAGGIDVASGTSFALWGGWAEYELDRLLRIVANTPPSLSFDGEALNYSYRTGPEPYQLRNGTGFAIHWYWLIDAIHAGNHEAIWRVGGETYTCEIRAASAR